jgi:Domain of unknown function (DUF1707)
VGVLALGASCVGVVGGFGALWAPHVAGAQTSVASPGGAEKVTESATGTGGVTVSPGALGFGYVGVDDVSKVQTVTLTGAGSTISITSFNLTNFEFQVVRDDCPGSVRVTNATWCTVTVKFDPWAAGSAESTLTITTTTGSASVLLAGTAVPATASAQAMGRLSSAGLRLDELLCLVFLLFLVIVGAAAWRDLGSRSRTSRVLAGTRSLGGMARPGALGSPVLASDAERDAAARSVTEAIAAGRLSIDEGTERIDAAFEAQHRDQLVSLVADLPASKRDRSPVLLHGVPLACTAGVSLAAIVLQAAAGAWELWPVAVATLTALALRRRD